MSGDSDKSEKEFVDWFRTAPDSGKRLFMQVLASELTTQGFERNGDHLRHADGRQIEVTSDRGRIWQDSPSNRKSTIHPGVCHEPRNPKLKSRDCESMLDLFAPQDKELESKKVMDELWTKMEQRLRATGRMTDEEIQRLKEIHIKMTEEET